MMRTNTDSVESGNRHVVILPTAMALVWARTSLLREFWDVVQAVGSWSGAMIIQDRKGLRLTLNQVELGRLNWGGQLIIGFGPESRNAIVAEGMARVDPDQPNAHRVLINIRNASDVNRALTLLRLAYLTLDSDPSELHGRRDFLRPRNESSLPLPSAPVSAASVWGDALDPIESVMAGG
jgi:hypothetical protein